MLEPFVDLESSSKLQENNSAPVTEQFGKSDINGSNSNETLHSEGKSFIESN